MSPKGKIERSRRRLLPPIFTFVVFAVLIWVYLIKDQEIKDSFQPAPLRPYVCNEGQRPRKVAVVGKLACIVLKLSSLTGDLGAGSAGSSAAYYIDKFSGKCDQIDIRVYERSSYVGGRSTTVNAYDSALEPVELGASIFVQVNHNLVSAADEFGLATEGFKSRRTEDDSELDEESDIGVWDGSDWVFYQNDNSFTWWNIGKILWKYGLAPIRTQKLMKDTVGKFLKMYESPHFPFRDLSEKAYELGLTNVIAVTGEQFLSQNKLDGAFARDVVQASTRVNYAQNLDTIHGLETMVCMATDGAMSVSGGNWQIFDGMLKASGAGVRLNTSVKGVQLQDDGKYTVQTLTSPDSGSLEQSEPGFDAVVLAAPYQFAAIRTVPEPLYPPSNIPYVYLFVTLFTSPRPLNPLMFNLGPVERVPSTVLTTKPNPAIRLPFYSISTLRTVTNPKTNEREFLYKIFSPAPLKKQYLHALLNSSSPNRSPSTVVSSEADTYPDSLQDPTADDPTPFTATAADDTKNIEDESTFKEDIITWIYQKNWYSYPIEYPRVTFESTTIDLESPSPSSSSDPKAQNSAESQTPNKGKIWYTSGIESFISTMETSSLMGMNVARLLVDEWLDEQGQVEPEQEL